MKLVIYPAVDETRLAAITTAAGGMTIVNAPDEASAVSALVNAEAFFWKTHSADVGYGAKSRMGAMSDSKP